MKKIPNVKDIIKIIEEIAPENAALPGDPVGLQCGDPALSGVEDLAVGDPIAETDIHGSAPVDDGDMLIQIITIRNNNQSGWCPCVNNNAESVV